MTKVISEDRHVMKTFFFPEKTTVNFEETEVCLNYSTQLMISGCKFWSDEDQAYKGDGLVVR